MTDATTSVRQLPMNVPMCESVPSALTHLRPGPMSNTTSSPTATPVDQIVFLLRHLGPQRESELVDTLGLPIGDLRQVTARLVDAGRIERQNDGRWRIIPALASSCASSRAPQQVSHGR